MIRFGYGRRDSDESEDAFTTEQGNVVPTAVVSGPPSLRVPIVRSRPASEVPEAPSTSRSPAPSRAVASGDEEVFDRRVSTSMRANARPVVGVERAAAVVPSVEVFESERQTSTESNGPSGLLGLMAGRARSVSEQLSSQQPRVTGEELFDRRERPVFPNAIPSAAPQGSPGGVVLPESGRQESTKSSASGNSRYDLRRGRTKSVSEILSHAQLFGNRGNSPPRQHSGPEDYDSLGHRGLRQPTETLRAVSQRSTSGDAPPRVNRDDTLKSSIVSMRFIQMSKDSDTRENSESGSSAHHHSHQPRARRKVDRHGDGGFDSPASSLVGFQSNSVSRGEPDVGVIRSRSHHRIDQSNPEGVGRSSDSGGKDRHAGYGEPQIATTSEVRDDYRLGRNGQLGSQKLLSSRPRKGDTNENARRTVSNKDMSRRGTNAKGDPRNLPAADRYVDISDDDDDEYSEDLGEHRATTADGVKRGNAKQNTFVDSSEEELLIEQRARKEGIPKNILSMVSVRKSYEGLNDDREVEAPIEPYRNDGISFPMVPLIVQNAERSGFVEDEQGYGDPLGSDDIDSETLFWGGGGMSSLMSTEEEPTVSTDLRTQMFRRSRMNSLTSEDGELRSYSAYQSNERNASNTSRQQNAPERKERRGNTNLSPQDNTRKRVVTKSEGDLLRNEPPEARPANRRRSENRSGAYSRDSHPESHLHLARDRKHVNRTHSSRMKETPEMLDDERRAGESHLRDRRNPLAMVKDHYHNDSTEGYTDDGHYAVSPMGKEDHPNEMAYQHSRDKSQTRRRGSLRHREQYDDHAPHRRAQDTSRRSGSNQEEPMERPRNSSRDDSRRNGSRSSTHSGENRHFTHVGHHDHQISTHLQKHGGHREGWNEDIDRGKYDSHRSRPHEIPRSGQLKRDNHQRDPVSYEVDRPQLHDHYSSSSRRYTTGSNAPGKNSDERGVSRRSSAEPRNIAESEEALDQNSPPEDVPWFQRNMSMSIRLSDM
ncbi:hypothetical protein BJ742DRAFT_23243 [Cladochytrium replicatum]|nr:hypothetical protein BJ742DRAFT_23243 [Cladochytrium replicatum]